MYGVNVGCTGGCLGERLNGIQEVSGSIPLISTTLSSYGFNCKSFYYMQDEGGLPPIPIDSNIGMYWNS